MKGGITTTAVTISSLIADIGSLVTAAITWIGEFVTAITDNKLLLLFVIVAFVGLGVGLIKRLIRV